MRIQSLLNPYGCGSRYNYRSSESPAPANTPLSVAPSIKSSQRQKLAKDAAIFTEGAKVKFPVNFPPFEAGDDKTLKAEYCKFQIYPMGDIQKKSARHIPYNSDKKDFVQKTGRDVFEVFQYQYKVPGDDKVYVVLWDYQTGLVRITALFKSCKYSKTTPAKVLNLNSGLKDICYSITGGALAAQGYWVPYEAAKAIAATFCYNIRYALAPVFGTDFLSQCIHPNDPEFAKFRIDPAIVQYCTEETKQWKEWSIAAKEAEQVAITAAAEQSAPVAGPETPQLKFISPWVPKAGKEHQRKLQDQESGYGTGTDEDYVFSPEVSPRGTTFTSGNCSQSPPSPPPHSPSERWLASYPSEVTDDQHRGKRTLSRIDYTGEVVGGPEEDIPASRRIVGRSLEFGPAINQNLFSDSELEVAEILVSISATEHTLHRSKRTRRGSRP